MATRPVDELPAMPDWLIRAMAEFPEPVCSQIRGFTATAWAEAYSLGLAEGRRKRQGRRSPISSTREIRSRAPMPAPPLDEAPNGEAVAADE